MKYTESLKKNNDFRVIYRKGRSVANKYLVLYRYNNYKAINRVGISVSKKVGNSVIRSRVTRLIKESYRLREEKISAPGWDFVIIARTHTKGASYEQISNALEHLMKQCKLYEETSIRDL